MVVGSSIAGRLACIAFGAQSIIKFLICSNTVAVLPRFDVGTQIGVKLGHRFGSSATGAVGAQLPQGSLAYPK
jgi:hypothetical protein